ncbi:unnamed protein product, partial [Durusdinium trenchii]
MLSDARRRGGGDGASGGGALVTVPEGGGDVGLEHGPTTTTMTMLEEAEETSSVSREKRETCKWLVTGLFFLAWAVIYSVIFVYSIIMLNALDDISKTFTCSFEAASGQCNQECATVATTMLALASTGMFLFFFLTALALTLPSLLRSEAADHLGKGDSFLTGMRARRGGMDSNSSSHKFKSDSAKSSQFADRLHQAQTRLRGLSLMSNRHSDSSKQVDADSGSSTPVAGVSASTLPEPQQQEHTQGAGVVGETLAAKQEKETVVQFELAVDQALPEEQTEARIEVVEVLDTSEPGDLLTGLSSRTIQEEWDSEEDNGQPDEASQENDATTDQLETNENDATKDVEEKEAYAVEKTSYEAQPIGVHGGQGHQSSSTHVSVDVGQTQVSIPIPPRDNVVNDVRRKRSTTVPISGTTDGSAEAPQGRAELTSPPQQTVVEAGELETDSGDAARGCCCPRCWPGSQRTKPTSPPVLIDGRYVLRPLLFCVPVCELCSCANKRCPSLYVDPTVLVIKMGKTRRFDSFCVVSWSQCGAQCCVLPWFILIITCTITVLSRTNPLEFGFDQGVCLVNETSSTAPPELEQQGVQLTWFAVLFTWIFLALFGVGTMVRTAYEKSRR